jgi:DNA-binding NtrC family response regulator
LNLDSDVQPGCAFMTITARNTTVLIVDDEAAVRSGLRDAFEVEGYQVVEASNSANAEVAYRSRRPDAAILDYRLPDGDALRLMTRLKLIDPSVPAFIVTGYPSIDLAVRSTKLGAEYFLAKPIEFSKLRKLVDISIESTNRHLGRIKRPSSAHWDPFIGESGAICNLFRQAAVVATTDTPVLIQGETGSGKGVLARWIHESSRRAGRSFMDLNCAGIARDLLESELFGHEKGAFTGASESKPGLFEIAEGGTVFLDELGDMDTAVQPKLLKVLEERTFRRVGGIASKTVDLRLIAASHQDLAELICDGRFREDLFFRVNAFPLRVPPLRERVEDIPALCEVILERMGGVVSIEKPTITEHALKKLSSHHWPGNIRELSNVLHRSILFAGGGPVDGHHVIVDQGKAAVVPQACSAKLIDVEKAHIEAVLRQCDGRVDQAASVLGIPLSSLYQKISRFGIHVRRERSLDVE